MKREKVCVCVFIDALGWDIVQRHSKFLKSIAPERKELKTILGYSSACDPSIISGLLPYQHMLWSSFYYSPETSPFKPLAPLGLLPSVVMDNHRIRSRVSNLIAKCHGYTGYFQLYNVPWSYLKYFDYAEKKRIYKPKGLPKGESIFDIMVSLKRPYHVNGPSYDDAAKVAGLVTALDLGDIELGYVTLGRLDAVMHSKGTMDPEVGELLEWYEKEIQKIYDAAQKRYHDVALYIFADHGMHDVKDTCDVQAAVESLGLHYGRDYTAMYDSTMARFWFMHEDARTKIEWQLQNMSQGRFLEDNELKQLGVFFEDYRYGERIWLLNSSVLMVPSFMGRKRIPGMHGYHPDDAESSPALLSNRAIPEDVTWIHHIFKLMTKELAIDHQPVVH